MANDKQALSSLVERGAIELLESAADRIFWSAEFRTEDYEARCKAHYILKRAASDLAGKR